MKKKLSDFLFIFGICLLAVGGIVGVVVGFVFGGGFNFVPAVTIWLLSVIIGAGFISVSSSVSKICEKKSDEQETLQMIIEKIKNDI